MSSGRASGGSSMADGGFGDPSNRPEPGGIHRGTGDLTPSMVSWYERCMPSRSGVRAPA